jgi:hypothetical protein
MQPEFLCNMPQYRRYAARLASPVPRAHVAHVQRPDPTIRTEIVNKGIGLLSTYHFL